MNHIDNLPIQHRIPIRVFKINDLFSELVMVGINFGEAFARVPGRKPELASIF
jgi:hypothetical protein